MKYIPPKRLMTLTTLEDAISWKTELTIVTAVRTSDPRKGNVFA
jgi:hypothetical protein